MEKGARITPPYPIYIYIYIYSGIGRCKKVGVGGGTQICNLCTFGKEPI